MSARNIRQRATFGPVTVIGRRQDAAQRHRVRRVALSIHASPLRLRTEPVQAWPRKATTTIEERDISNTLNANMNKQDPAESFFEMEKQRLIGEINSVCHSALGAREIELTSRPSKTSSRTRTR